MKGHSGQIRKAVELLMAAQRLIIYACRRAILSDGAKELVELTRLLGFPITNTR
ncbi:MAG: hypothetical protein U1F68_08995 [Gammaproteobacteria bacterium]